MRTPTCPADEILKAHVDGELGRVERIGVRMHLRRCARCAEEAEAMRKIGEQVRGLAAAVEPPEGLRDAILARVRFGDEAVRQRRYDFARWASGAAVVGTLGFVLAAILFPVFAQSRHGARRPNAWQMAQSAPPAPAGAGAPAGTAAAPGTSPAPQRGESQTTADGPLEAMGGMHVPAYEERASPGRRNGDPYGGAKFNGVPVVPDVGMTTDDINRYARGQALEDFRRKVRQTADLSVRVNRRLEDLQTGISARLKKAGGYVESATLASPPEGDRVLTMTLRAPVDDFDGTLAWLGSLGEVTAKDVRGEDVTGTWIDQRAEVRELRAGEERLAKLIDRGRTAAERAEARRELLMLRPQIRASEERFALTSKLAALATIRLKLTEEPQARIQGNLLNDAGKTLQSAVSAFLLAVRVPLALLIWIAVFAPLWVPCLLVYRWATKMARQQEEAREQARRFEAAEVLRGGGAVGL